MNNENCELCNWSVKDTGPLLDGVCERCNPDSHRSEAFDELDRLIMENASVSDLSGSALELWKELNSSYREVQE